MPDQKKLASRTIRIDLIPDVPEVPSRRGVVIASPTKRHRPAQVMRKEVNAEDSRYDELLQNIYDAVLICTMNGRITDANMRAADFLLYGREELSELMIFDIVSGSDESLIQALCENLENERFTLIQAYCVRKDGTFFPVEISVNKLQLGEMQLCFFIRDITLRRQAEEMLRTEHNAIQNSGNGIAVADLDAMLEYVNPAMANMWGYTNADDLLGQDVRVLLSDKESADRMIATVLGEHQTWVGEMKAKKPDGIEFDVQLSAGCNRNSEGEPMGIVFSFVDISDRKRAEDAERETERTRVMLESLGAACHYLGQPATVLLANLGIIQRRLKTDDPTVAELVKGSLEAVESLGEILHKLNSVNEYKTTQYLEKPEGTDSQESRIIEI
jgi:PAS domain S-box-containing protein